MKNSNTLFTMLVIGSLCSFSAIAQEPTININGEAYSVVPSNHLSTRSAGASAEKSNTVRVGDSVVLSANADSVIQPEPKTISGEIEIVTDEQQALVIAEKFDLEFLGYEGGIALLYAKKGTDVKALRSALNTELNVPVRIHLQPNDIKPQ